MSPFSLFFARLVEALGPVKAAELIHEFEGQTLALPQAAVAPRMQRAWGPESIYAPIQSDAAIKSRDRVICQSFNGHNHAELAREFRLSLRAIYHIIKRAQHSPEETP